jgi:hypothetical protein
MTFDEMLRQVKELLQQQKRVSYQGLKRRFDLDDAYLDDLKKELIGALRLAVDEDGCYLVWTGDGEATQPAAMLQPTRPHQKSRFGWSGLSLFFAAFGLSIGYTLGKTVPTSSPEFAAVAVGVASFVLCILGWCVGARISSQIRTHIEPERARVAVAWVIGALGFLVFSFINAPTHVVSPQEDLTRYIDNARFWAATEAQINNAIATVREDQFVHDDVIIGTLRPVVGVSQEYVQQLENYQPRTPPLRNVHLEYIESWRSHYLALASIIDSVEKKDYIQLATSNNDLLEAQRSVSDALADLARLMREAGLRSDSPEDQQSTPPAPPSPGPGFEVSPKGM